jgi:hypothetical protein
MPTNEGFVATLKKDGKAEVVIQPISLGIPGASARVNRHVCHCIADGSTFTIEAVNSVDAKVGDYVSVHRDTSGLAKNAAALLGIPLMGLIAGFLLAGFLTDGFSLCIVTGIIAIAACLSVGITIGVWTFRLISVSNLPIIDRIISTRLEAASGYDQTALCMATECRNCHAKA